MNQGSSNLPYQRANGPSTNSASSSATAGGNRGGATGFERPPSTDPSRRETAEPTLPPSALDKVRDVDGVRLIKHHHSSSHFLLGTHSEEPENSVTHARALPASSQPSAASGATGKKMLVPEVDPQHYRMLVKGIIPLRSSMSRGSKPRKKAVHFSDENGYTLSCTRNYERQDEAPEVPLYATAYLNLNKVDETAVKPAVLSRPADTQEKVLRTNFTQPGVLPEFLSRVQAKKVALEFCVAHDRDMSLSGTVRVANLSFHKSVVIRYTFNKWKSTEPEITASFIYTSDEDTDRFSFVLRLPGSFGVGSECEFAIRYDAGSAGTHWDNNNGENYRITCHTRAAFSLPAGRGLDGVPPFPWQQLM